MLPNAFLSSRMPKTLEELLDNFEDYRKDIENDTFNISE